MRLIIGIAQCFFQWGSAFQLPTHFLPIGLLCLLVYFYIETPYECNNVFPNLKYGPEVPEPSLIEKSTRPAFCLPLAFALLV